MVLNQNGRTLELKEYEEDEEQLHYKETQIACQRKERTKMKISKTLENEIIIHWILSQIVVLDHRPRQGFKLF